MWPARLATVALVVIATLPASSPALGQFVREHDARGLRPFHGGPSVIRRSFQSDAEANAIFKRILSVSGLAGMEDRIIIRASAETSAAEAFFDGTERLIFYNAEFVQRMARNDKNYWSMVAILAHEVGHHIRYHTVISGNDHKFELEADYQAGFILRRMGATLEQTTAAFKAIGTDAATSTHSARADRVQSATLGWIDAGAPPSLPVEPAPPQSSRAEVAQFCQAIAANPSIAVVKALVEAYKGTPMAACALARLAELEKQVGASPAKAPAPAPVKPPQPAAAVTSSIPTGG